MWQVLLPIFTTFSFLCSFGFVVSDSLVSASASEVSNKMRFNIVKNVLPAATLYATANCTNLYVSSYSGNVTTYDLERTYSGYSTKFLGVTNGSAPQASWLELNSPAKVVYGLDEAWNTPNGTITAYTTKNGALSIISKHVTFPGAVSTIVYDGGKALAVAHYGGQALTTWSILADGSLKNIGNFIFTQKGPGANPARQDLPHPHEALVDPTDSYILAPDLGSDLLRTFAINHDDSTLRELTPFPTPPGSGPRHGAFYTSGWSSKDKKENTYFFLVSELANSVTSYKVTYGKDGLGFTLVDTYGIYGNLPIPDGAAAAEGILSPDNRFFHTSSRNATFLSTPNPDKSNTTALASDTLQTWVISPTTGKLTFQANYPAGGETPRQFSINKRGDLAAVGLQTTGRFVVMERDIKSGAFGKIVTSVEDLGQVTAVIWDESK